MQTLNLDPELSSRMVKRSASEFPGNADRYVCDKCGRDITVLFHPGRAHLRRPLGPVRIVCPCGQRYLSGATEWDYMSEWEKRHWLWDIALMFFLTGVVAAYGWATYFAVLHRRFVMIVFSVMGIPFVLAFLIMIALMSSTPFEIAASMWRTRVLRRG